VVEETAFIDDNDVLSAALAAAVLKKSNMDDVEKAGDDVDDVAMVVTCFGSSFVVLLVESLTVDDANCVLKYRALPLGLLVL
jgi:hypothetical protein